MPSVAYGLKNFIKV